MALDQGQPGPEPLGCMQPCNFLKWKLFTEVDRLGDAFDSLTKQNSCGNGGDIGRVPSAVGSHFEREACL